MSGVFPRRVFSGIQPTGGLHLGNYMGAVRKWVSLQEEEDSNIFSIVDLHSITQIQEPPAVKCNRILETTASVLGCGVDPSRSIVFQQSRVLYHPHLAWVLSCLSTVNQAERLPQYKDKRAALPEKEEFPLGMLSYPVLQAADIMLYKATHVPVGYDQSANLFICNFVSKRFNHTYGLQVFPEVDIIIADDPSKKVMCLDSPTNKMSKSRGSEMGRINLVDSPEFVRDKIRNATTDSESSISYDPKTRPGLSNLIELHSLFTDCDMFDVAQECCHLSQSEFKDRVADAAIATLQPIRNNILDLLRNKDYLCQVLEEGREKALPIAEETWTEVNQLVGFGRKLGDYETKELPGVVKRQKKEKKLVAYKGTHFNYMKEKDLEYLMKN